MFDIKAIEKEAKAELAKELSEKAKVRLKEKLRLIAKAEEAVANLKREYEALLLEVTADA